MLYVLVFLVIVSASIAIPVLEEAQAEVCTGIIMMEQETMISGNH